MGIESLLNLYREYDQYITNIFFLNHGLVYVNTWYIADDMQNMFLDHQFMNSRMDERQVLMEDF